LCWRHLGKGRFWVIGADRAWGWSSLVRPEQGWGKPRSWCREPWRVLSWPSFAGNRGWGWKAPDIRTVNGSQTAVDGSGGRAAGSVVERTAWTYCSVCAGARRRTAAYFFTGLGGSGWARAATFVTGINLGQWNGQKSGSVGATPRFGMCAASSSTALRARDWGRTKHQQKSCESIWRRCQSKFLRVSQSDLYPGLVGNAKLAKPSELPIMSARDISRHRHSLTQFTSSWR